MPKNLYTGDIRSEDGIDMMLYHGFLDHKVSNAPFNKKMNLMIDEKTTRGLCNYAHLSHICLKRLSQVNEFSWLNRTNATHQFS